MCDFQVNDHGTMLVFRPMTRAATEKVFDLGLEYWQWMGLRFCVDRRPAETLIQQLEEEGFMFDKDG